MVSQGDDLQNSSRELRVLGSLISNETDDAEGSTSIYAIQDTSWLTSYIPAQYVISLESTEGISDLLLKTIGFYWLLLAVVPKSTGGGEGEEGGF